MSKSLKNHTGFALTEVLVAAFVIGVGFLAMTSMQGTMLGSSRENKTRAEAMALANAKLEELRGITTKTAYDALASSTTPETIVGKTESFRRSWTVVNSAANEPVTKRVTVSVCWPSNTCSDPDKRVNLQTIIAFEDLKEVMQGANNAQNVSSGGGAPSVNAESSDDIRDVIHLSTPRTIGTLITQDGKTYIVDGEPGSTTSNHAVLAGSCDGLNDFENNLKTRRVDYDGVPGNEAIELHRVITAGGTQYCTPEIRYNGGVIIPIRGVVHSKATTGSGNNASILSVQLFAFNASETGAYCYFNPAPGATSAPYVCYVGGNCSGVTDPAAIDDNDVTKCPSGSNKSAAKVGPGGWRGKVGLRGVAGTSSTYYNVCFAEEIAGPPQSLDSARNYYTRRGGNNEGINKPYSCHDFLIINGKSNERNVSNECKDQARTIAGLNLASKTVQRNITSGPNLFDPVVDTQFCQAGSYRIVGSIEGTGGNIPTSVQITDGSAISSCTATATQYTCNITTNANAVTISGTYSGQTVSCELSPISAIGCTLTFSPGAPRYIITGTVNGTATEVSALRLAAEYGTSNTPCTITAPTGTSSGSYRCEFQTTAQTAVIRATLTDSTRYNVTPQASSELALNGTPGSTTNLSGGAFTVTTNAVYTVSGTIRIDRGVNNLTSVSLSMQNGQCTLTPPSGGWGENKTGSYSCTAQPGTSSMTFSITPSCSNKKYRITDGTNTSIGTGSLTIGFGSSGLQSNRTINITVDESTENCK